VGRCERLVQVEQSKWMKNRWNQVALLALVVPAPAHYMTA
jgi:hypothetical protein